MGCTHLLPVLYFMTPAFSAGIMPGLLLPDEAVVNAVEV